MPYGPSVINNPYPTPSHQMNNCMLVISVYFYIFLSRVIKQLFLVLCIPQHADKHCFIHDSISLFL